jgi:hypothetical protein
MNSQSSCGLGNVLVAVGENAVDVFPFRLSESRNGDLFIRFGRFDLCASAFERTEYVIGIGWLREKVNRSEPNSIDSGSDASEAGKNKNLHVGADRLEIGDYS